MATVREDPYTHDADTKHTIRVGLDRLTTGVLHHISSTLVEECGNDMTVTLNVLGQSGPLDDRQLVIEVTT
jgi:hypothetical protein